MTVGFYSFSQHYHPHLPHREPEQGLNTLGDTVEALRSLHFTQTYSQRPGDGDRHVPFRRHYNALGSLMKSLQDVVHCFPTTQGLIRRLCLLFLSSFGQYSRESQWLHPFTAYRNFTRYSRSTAP